MSGLLPSIKKVRRRLCLSAQAKLAGVQTRAMLRFPPKDSLGESGFTDAGLKAMQVFVYDR